MNKIIHIIKKYASLILHIIKKDLKLLIRSKSSAAIILLGPIFIILLVSLAFNTSGLYDIKVGVFSENYNSAANSILDKLKDKEFKVIKLNSAKSCIEEVKEGKVHICIIMPPNIDLTKDIQKEITFHVDYSRINLAWVILDTVSSKVAEQSSKWSFNLTSNLLEKLDETKKELNKKDEIISTSLENENQIIFEANKISSKLSNLDTKFDIKDSHFGELKKEIEEFFEDNNFSESETKKIVKELNNLEEDLMILDEKLVNVDTIVGSTQNEIVSIKSSAAANKVNLEDIRKTIEDVNRNIDSLNVKNATNIVDPLITSIKPITSGKTNLDFIASTIIMLIVMFISVLLASTTVIAEKTSKAYFRRYISSTHDIIFVIATYLTVMFIILLQMILIFSVSSVFLHVSFLSSNIIYLTIILLVLASFFILSGMLIGYLFNSEETSLLAAISFNSVLLFFSNTILPIENMPTAIKEIAMFNPFVIGQKLINKILLFQMGIDSSLYYILVYIVLLILGVILIQKKIKNTWA